VIILSPTKELTLQTYKTLLIIGERMKTKIHMSIGGTKVYDDKMALKEG